MRHPRFRERGLVQQHAAQKLSHPLAMIRTRFCAHGGAMREK